MSPNLWSKNTPRPKNLCKFVLSEFCEISTNFDNFWQKAGQMAKSHLFEKIIKLVEI